MDIVPRGPVLNDNSRSFTTRDSLGVEGVATTIQGEVCPIVNTVTPRAFYWPFMIWIYYDFYKYSGIEEKTYTNFNNYLKRQDYFFVLATLLTPESDRNGLVGIQQSEIDIRDNPTGPYKYNPNYFVSRFGGMMYYNAGCLSMYFVTDNIPEKGENLSFPILTKEGEKMALAFENVIKHTDYYTKYRIGDCAVPLDVLKEYGTVIKFNLEGFDECKSILRKYMFSDDRALHLTKRGNLLTECGNYIRLLKNQYEVSILGREVCRRIFFDYELPSGKKVNIPDSLKQVANKWEIIVGRQYFTSGLEMIWKYMLELLVSPMKLKKWFYTIFDSSEFSFNIECTVKDIIDTCYFSFSEREKMINDATRGRNSNLSVENGLKIILSIYNRFSTRADLGDEKAFYSYGIDSQSISFTELFEVIKEYMNRSARDLLLFIMKEWLVEQHYITAFEKMMQNRDGFYYEYIDGYYIRKHKFDLRFQDIRMTSLSQVMVDLDML